MRDLVVKFIIEHFPLLFARPEYREKYLALEKTSNGWKIIATNSHLTQLFLVVENYFERQVVFIYND
jgi:hypothetical protein